MTQDKELLHQLIRRLQDDGTLTRLFKAGVVSWTVLLYYDIYLSVDLEIKTRSKRGELQVIREEIADKFGVSSRTVQRAILEMNKKV